MMVSDFCLHHCCYLFVKLIYVYRVFLHNFFKMSPVWNDFKFRFRFSQCLRKFTLSSSTILTLLSEDFNCRVNWRQIVMNRRTSLI